LQLPAGYWERWCTPGFEDDLRLRQLKKLELLTLPAATLSLIGNLEEYGSLRFRVYGVAVHKLEPILAYSMDRSNMEIVLRDDVDVEETSKLLRWLRDVGIAVVEEKVHGI
jgi:hypothetical protein